MVAGVDLASAVRAGSAQSGPTPIVFGPEDRALVGLVHTPVGTPRSVGVVLCSPVAYEGMCTHRSYRVLADLLAAAGFPCIRFDYDGAGDSAGDMLDPGRLEAWKRSVGAAADELRRWSGVPRVALFGVRFGATLAMMSAAGRDDVDSLVLWAPVTSGRAYVREMRAFRVLGGPKGPPQPRSDGGEVVAGYLFEADTLSSMAAVDLLAQAECPVGRALLLPRDDLPGQEGRLAKHLQSRGVDAHLVQKPGYAEMMRDPQDTVVPRETLGAVVEWLERAPAAGLAAAPAAPASRSFSTGGVTETPLFFPMAAENRSLFGVVTEPRAARAPRRRSALLFLNVGTNHHVGPNRMYVVLARELGAQGYTSLRFDVGGLGESSMPVGSRGNRLYSKDSLGDVLAAMNYLTETRGFDRFVLAGLCSGAYMAFHTALEDERVVGEILMNPQTFAWREGDSLKAFQSTRYYAKSMLDREVWARVLRGDVYVSGIASALRRRLGDRLRTQATAIRARVLGGGATSSDVERGFRSLGDRGVETLLVYSFNDGGRDVIDQHLGKDARRMRGRKNFRLEIVDGADHTFTPIETQQVLYDLVKSFIASRVG